MTCLTLFVSLDSAVGGLRRARVASRQRVLCVCVCVCVFFFPNVKSSIHSRRYISFSICVYKKHDGVETWWLPSSSVYWPTDRSLKYRFFLRYASSFSAKHVASLISHSCRLSIHSLGRTTPLQHGMCVKKQTMTVKTAVRRVFCQIQNQHTLHNVGRKICFTISVSGFCGDTRTALRPMTMETRCCNVFYTNYSKKKSAADTLVPPLWWKQYLKKMFASYFSCPITQIVFHTSKYET